MDSSIELDRASLPDGTLLSLHKQDGQFILKYNDLELMSTDLTLSEQMLAELGCADLLEGAETRPEHPRVLIGGLGMGFTLKRVLEVVGSPATVDVAELMSQVIDWNRSYLVEHNGPLLEDPRTNVLLADLFDCLGEGERYDAILIDIDDTPNAVITADNVRLYTPAFLKRLRESLNPGGCLAYWMAEPSPKLEKALKKAGFTLEEHRAKAHEDMKEEWHRIYVARVTAEADGSAEPGGKTLESGFAGIGAAMKGGAQKLLDQIPPELRERIIEQARTHGPGTAAVAVHAAAMRTRNLKVKLALKGLGHVLKMLDSQGPGK